MKQAIYIFSIYVGIVAFFTLSYFGLPMEIDLFISVLAMIGTGVVIYAANKNEEKRRLINA